MTGGRSNLRTLVARLAGVEQPVRRVCVVTDDNASFAYFLEPRLEGAGTPGGDIVLPVSANPLISLPEADLAHTAIVFCRYTSSRWMHFCERHRQRLAAIVMLVDDDFGGLAADRSQPIAYRLKLWTRHLRHRRRLEGVLDHVLVSAPPLAASWRNVPTSRLQPTPSRFDLPIARGSPAGPRRIAFHASGSHREEHEWMAPLAAAILRERPDVHFEVVVPRGVRRLWHEVTGVVRHDAMPWPAYRGWSRERGADIMLVPLFETDGSHSRAPTKRIDACRMNAAFVTNARKTYGVTATERLCASPGGLDRAQWLELVVSLLEDRRTLDELAAENRTLVQSWE